MKSCERYELLASLVLDGEAAAEEQAELAAHLETCPACRAYMEDIQRIHKVFVQEEIAAPEGFAVRVMDRVRETEQDRPVEKTKKMAAFPRWRRWAALAACCAVVTLGVWTGLRTGDRDALVSTDMSPRIASDASGGAVSAAPAAQEPDASGIYESDEAADADIESLSETPPEIPEEYQELAKSAVRDGEGEGPYQPLGDSGPETLQPAGTAAPPVYAVNGETSDSSLPSETAGLDREETEDGEADGAEPAPETGPQSEPEDEDSSDGQDPADPGPLEEPAASEETVEPVEVVNIPEPGVLTAYGTAAQEWVETVLGLEWAAGGSYPLTAEQYSGLLQTLDEAGELYSVAPGEGYCLMTE